MFDLNGQVAIVTGSSRGIGRSIAEQLAHAGAKVVVSSRTEADCDTVVEHIRASGGTATAIPCNVSHAEQLQRLVDATIAQWGRLDILVCNAAVNPYYGPMEGMPEGVYDKVMNSNARSTFVLCNMAAPHIARQGGGSIIIVSSIGGYFGSPTLAVYCIAKAAEFALARSLAVEWGPRGVRANCIAPGLVKTDFARALWEDPKRLALVEESAPLRRIGQPDDIGGVAVFLASRAAAYITGQTIAVDGGLTIKEPV
jgi:dehydrogenase/reductase SDR family protein 4